MYLDWKRIKKVAHAMRDRPLSIAGIMRRGRVSQRTAYRWVEVLEGAGCTVVRVRMPRGRYGYQILAVPPRF